MNRGALVIMQTVFHVIRVNIILTTSHRGDHHEALEMAYCEWKPYFWQHVLGQRLES